MNVVVINCNRSGFKVQDMVQWCIRNFEDVIKIPLPSLAELHRVSYDDQVNGIVVFYFREDHDYTHFLLRWS